MERLTFELKDLIVKAKAEVDFGYLDLPKEQQGTYRDTKRYELNAYRSMLRRDK